MKHFLLLAFIIGFGFTFTTSAQSYCTPNQNNQCGAGFNIYIDGIEFDSIKNTGSGCANTTANSYTDYPASSYTTTVLRGKTYTLNYTAANTFDAIASVWIDYDQSFSFDAAEWTQIGTQVTAGTTVSINITIPCNATLGSTKMRIRSRLSGSANGSGNACSTFGSGEAEDYTITIADNPRYFVDAVPFQNNTSDVAPGSTSQEILGVQLITSGCGNLNLSEFDFNFTGTSTADFTNAILYYGGANSSFNSASQLANVAANNALNFSVNKDIDADTVYLWLAFDVDANATVGNILDADIATITLGGNNATPTNTSANGSRTINTYGTVNLIDVFTSNIDPVFSSTGGNDIIGFNIDMNTGAPAPLTQINFNINGSSKSSDISNIRIWYTGTTNYFDSTQQLIGSIAAATGTLSVNVSGFNLASGSNYFWITYDIAAGATPNDTVDAELVSVVINGSTNTPSNGAPADFRLVLRSYCIPTITQTGGANYIESFSIGDIQNTNSGSTNFNGNKYSVYLPSFYTTDLVRGNKYVVTFTNSGEAQRAGFWIDYNSDGTFGTTEFTSIGTNLPVDTTVSISITIPCNSTLGWTRIRVRTRVTAGTLTSSDACSTFGTGEAEDYIIRFIDDTISYTTTFTANTADVSPSQTNQEVIGVKVVSSSCFTNKLTQFDFTTSGTTNLSDISTPQVWYTGNTNTFSTNTLFGSGAVGNGTFSITGNQTLANDTNYFWLTFDIDANATLNNYVDAQCTNMIINNTNEAPSVTNPKGERMINGVMTVSSVDANQKNASQLVDKGSIYQQIMEVQINMNSGSPINLTQLDFNTNGTNTPSTNISFGRLFYSGTSATYDTSVSFGTIVNSPNGAFSYKGNLALKPGINHFWLTYDIKAAAIAGDSVDAEFTSATIDGSNYSPTTQAPKELSIISNNYCTAAYQQGCGTTFINGIEFNTINNQNSGCTSGTANKFTSYSISKYFTQVNKGSSYDLKYTNGNAQQIVGCWFDWDQNGTYDTNEFTLISSSIDSGVTITTSISIPCSAKAGFTRFRVRSRTSTGTITSADPCTLFGSGEAEEYVIELMDNPGVSILGNDTSVCEGTQYSLDPGPSYTAVTWSNGATTRGITVTTSGTYSFTATTTSGCAATDTIQVNFVPFMPALPNDSTFCGSVSMQLDAGSGLGSYVWSTGDQTQTISVSSPGIYWVVTQNAIGCMGYDSIVIGLEQPSVFLGNDTTLCEGNTLLLSAGSFNSYTWSDGSVGNTLNVSKSGTYWVEVATANGCKSIDSIDVIFQKINKPSLGADAALCDGTTATLDAGAGYSSYLWSDGSTNQTLTISQGGTYWVSVSNTIGCTTGDSITFTPSSTTVYLGNDQTFCEGDSTELDAGPGFSTYLWNNGATTRKIWAYNSGDYGVTVTNNNGCEASDSLKVKVFPAPDAAFTYTSNGTTVSFTPKVSGLVCNWDFGDGTTSTKESPTYLYSAYGNYTVTLKVTNGNGCSASSTQTISLAPVGLSGIIGWNTMTVFPNPTNGLITIKGISEKGILQVYDITGRIVYSTKVQNANNNQNYSIDLSQLAKGTYQIKFSSTEQVYINTLIIE